MEKIPFLRWLHEHYGIGFDFCGRVIDIGSKVTKFKVVNEEGYNLTHYFMEFDIYDKEGN